MTSSSGQKNGKYFLNFKRILALCLNVFVLSLLHLQASFATEVDLKLVLAVDVSSSVDSVEARLQKDGYLQALVHPFVIDAITTGPKGKIAAIYVEYAGKNYQRVVVGWSVVDGLKSARAFVQKLALSPVSTAPSTSISALIDFSVQQILISPHKARRAVIDVSGDGPNSDGRPVWDARDDAIARGVTINGLPILSSRPDPQGFSPAVGVTSHYRRYVIGGPGSFVMSVNEFENFGPALVKKLIREIRDSTRQLVME